MSEFERLFEILDALGIGHGVTRQQIGNALLNSTASTPVRPAVRDFIKGAIIHTRALHPDMNDYVLKDGRYILQAIKAAPEHATCSNDPYPDRQHGHCHGAQF